jgi:hypothetical protein
VSGREEKRREGRESWAAGAAKKNNWCRQTGTHQEGVPVPVELNTLPGEQTLRLPVVGNGGRSRVGESVKCQDKKNKKNRVKPGRTACWR